MSSENPISDPPPVRRPALATSAGLNFAAQLSVAALSLANVIVISRALGPSGRGEVVFLTAVSYITAQLAALSISEAASNIAGGRPRQRAALATNALLFALVLGIVAAIALAGLIGVFPSIGPQTSTALEMVMLATIPPLVLQTYFQRIVLADYGFAVVNLSLLIPPVASLLVNSTLAAAGVISVASAFSIWVVGQIVSIALLVWYTASRLAGFGRPDRKLGREMIGFGLKAHGSQILMWSNYRIDQWLVGSIAGARELGLYSVAVSWAEGLFLLPQALTTAQRPDLVRTTPEPAGRQSADAFRAVALITAPLVLFVLLAAPYLCVSVFGESFRGSIGDLRMLVAGAFGIAAMKVLGSALIAQRRPLLETLASLVAFAATIALDIILIPRLGGLGAALASTAAYTAGGITVAAIATRSLSIPLAAFVPRPSDVRTVLRSWRRLTGGRSSRAESAL